MKKIIIGSIAILAITAVTAFNVQLNTVGGSKLSNISLANVEALANGENSVTSNCSIEWYANVAGQTVKLSCSVNCTTGKAECKTGSCKCA